MDLEQREGGLTRSGEGGVWWSEDGERRGLWDEGLRDELESQSHRDEA